jgi:drug/metabolite transporter (DMT)-like permease
MATTRTPHLESRWAAIALASFVVFLWATSWVLIKIGLEEIPALTFAGLRYFFAFLLLLPLLPLSKRTLGLRDLTRSKLIKLIGLGLLLYSVTQGAQFIALAYMPAVTVNLVWSFSPIAVVIIGIKFLDERPTLIQLIGVMLAVTGAILYFYPTTLPSNYQIGIGASLVGILANAGASVLGRDVNRPKDLAPLVITVISMGIGSITLLAIGLWLQGLPHIGLRGWLIIGWLAAINTALAFTLWNFTLRNLTATESSVINGSMLIWIPILAVLFLDESIHQKEALGLIIAGVGTIIVQLGMPFDLRRFFSFVHKRQN